MIATLIILLLSAILFVSGRVRSDLVAICALLALLLCQVLTPAEGLSGRFTRMDRKVYGKIKGVTDREFYTNSFHVPVYHNISIANKIKLEGPYHAYTNAGHISYIELDGNVTQNVDAFEKVVRIMKEKYISLMEKFYLIC